MHFARIRACFYPGVPVVIRNGGNFSFPPQNQNSAGAAVFRTVRNKVCVLFFFLCMHALYSCVCPRGKSNQRSCVVERLYKKE